MFNNSTWTGGQQHELDYKLSGFIGNADCGQHAAGNASDNYRVGSIDIHNPHLDQAPDYRAPFWFVPDHGMSSQQFDVSHIPTRAQAVAYLRIHDRAFHYAKLDGDVNNRQLVHTDANKSPRPGMGVFSVIDIQAHGSPVLGQKSVQLAVTHNKHGFIDYCLRTYVPKDDLDYLFFYCKFY